MRISLKKITRKAKEWTSQHYRLLPVSTCKEYAVNNDVTYTVLKEGEKALVTPVRYVDEPIREDVMGFLPERYFCLLRNVEIIGASNVVIGKDSFIYDLLANKKETYNITDIGLFRVWNSPVRLGKKYLPCYQIEGEKIEKGINFVGNFSGNYYHYIYEILVKWYLVDKMDIPPDVPVIVDASARKIPQFAELLHIFSSGRDVIYVERGELRRVNELYYPSMVNFIPPNLKKMEDLRTEDVVFDLDSISYLRTHFLSCMGETGSIHQNTPKKFFISRKNTKWRQYNEDEVIKVVVSKGYEVVYPEMMTVKEQFSLFNNADEIVAASGAAISNIICCKPGTKVLVLVSVRIDGAIFSTIAKTLGIDMRYMVGTITNYNNVQSDFRIDCDQLKEVL